MNQHRQIPRFAAWHARLIAHTRLLTIAAVLISLFAAAFTLWDSHRSLRQLDAGNPIAQQNSASIEDNETELPPEISSIEPPPPAAYRPPTIGAAPSPRNLVAARAALETARNHLAKASTGNKGGYVEQAQANIEKALAHVSEALEFAAAHPEVTQLASKAAALPAGPEGGTTAINVRRALDAVRMAHAELDQAPGGNLGGAREKANAEMQRAAANLIAGVNFVRSRGR